MQRLSLIRLSVLLAFGLVLVGGSLAVAQDNSDQEPNDELAMTIELYSTIMAKTFEKADVEDEQMDKIKEVIDECIPILVTSRQKLEGLLTPEQKKKYGAALRQALKAKYTQQEAEDYALRKLKLPAEKLAEYKAAKKAVDEINEKMNNRIAALLTDEQKARLPMFGGTKKEMVTHKIKFPGMKTDEDAKKIETLVKTIKGAKVSETNVPTQAIRIDLPKGANLDAEMEKLIKAENKILEGWERMKMGTVIRSKTVPPGNKVTPGAKITPGSTPKGAGTSGK